MFNSLASKESLAKTTAALAANNIASFVVENAAAAKAKIQEIIPTGSEVMTMTSVTLDTTGISDLLNSPSYVSVRNQLPNLSGREKARLGAAPTFVVGSVHAVTEDGHVVIASNSGSQLPAYAYGSEKVVWVVGTQKIVSNLEAATKRLQEYVLPLESERANKAYNITSGSFISKLLIVNREMQPNRITIIFVNEVLGF